MNLRTAIKTEAREFIRYGTLSPLLISAIVIVIVGILNNVSPLTAYENEILEDMMLAAQQGIEYVPSEPIALSPMAIFFSVLILLVTTILYAGYDSYCMGIRRGEKMSVSSLLDGLSIAGKVIWCDILVSIRIALWSCLFVIPGFIAIYRYRFAVYNIIRDPSLTVPQAIALSCYQTRGMKAELFALDLSFLGWQLFSALTLGLLNVFVLPYTTLSNLGYYEEALRRMEGKINDDSFRSPEQ